jgi:hypothetical protein
MAAMYNDKLNLLLNQLLPCSQFVRRPRPSDPWFDGECRAPKRVTRRLERAYLAAIRRTDAVVTAAAFIDQSWDCPPLPLMLLSPRPLGMPSSTLFDNSVNGSAVCFCLRGLKLITLTLRRFGDL